jgi:hypothetical protein
MATKKRKEANKILEEISRYQRTKEGFNPCSDPVAIKKYPRVKQACKIGGKIDSAQSKQEATKAKTESQKAQVEAEKQTNALIQSVTADSTATTEATAAASVQGGQPQEKGGMTKYLVIGGVGLLLIGGVAFFLLKKPSSAVAAPAK